MVHQKTKQYKHATELSKYVWGLKDYINILYNIKWQKNKYNCQTAFLHFQLFVQNLYFSMLLHTNLAYSDKTV